jgi:hypothetical protein
LRVLLVTTEHPGNLRGGLGSFIRLQLEGLRAADIEVRIACINLDKKPMPIEQNGYTVDYILQPKHNFPWTAPKASSSTQHRSVFGKRR